MITVAEFTFTKGPKVDPESREDANGVAHSTYPSVIRMCYFYDIVRQEFDSLSSTQLQVLASLLATDLEADITYK